MSPPSPQPTRKRYRSRSPPLQEHCRDLDRDSNYRERHRPGVGWDRNRDHNNRDFDRNHGRGMSRGSTHDRRDWTARDSEAHQHRHRDDHHYNNIGRDGRSDGPRRQHGSRDDHYDRRVGRHEEDERRRRQMDGKEAHGEDRSRRGERGDGRGAREREELHREVERERDNRRSEKPAATAPVKTKGFRWKDEQSSTPMATKSKRSGGADGKDKPRATDRAEQNVEEERQEAEDTPQVTVDASTGLAFTGSKADKKAKSKHSAPAPENARVVPSAPGAEMEEMIIVHVNDRLGTKAAIPCLASDRVREFKILVAARIGREPHEIMLKRQSERPFKDVLTLQDYGVSNGVQLDLEVDTGD